MVLLSISRKCLFLSPFLRDLAIATYILIIAPLIIEWMLHMNIKQLMVVVGRESKMKFYILDKNEKVKYR